MKFWYRRSLIAWCLLPVSWLFCALAMLRARLYRSGLLRSHKPAVPVIIVGNISVGGTGKTPLLIALCELLQQYGLQPGVVSRGYGGSVDHYHSVTVNDSASEVGDEPLLIHLRTGCPVVIGKDRAAAAQALLAQHDCTLILSDDGLQHYRLQRDVELAVVDAQRMHGNGFCLPAGPLREPPSRLQQVDMVVFHDAQADARSQPAFHLKVTAVQNLKTGQTVSLDSFRGQSVHAVAGIGHPQRFFDQLRQHGIEIVEQSFDDHHAFSVQDIAFDDDRAVLMTEKDAVKCRTFADERCWSVAVSAELNPAIHDAFVSQLRRVGIGPDTRQEHSGE